MTLPRRKFSTAGAGLLLCPARLAFGTAANSAITLGLIGSGGRGAAVGGLFARHDVVRITALCDLFQDRLASAVDAVLIATPPFRHPEHFEAAVQAGKPIYLEKPVGVDVLNWFFDSLPASAAGAGGRLMRVNGDNMDHVNVTYEYPERRRAVLTATHIGACGFRKVSEEFYGLTGVIEMQVDSLLHQRGPEETETHKAAQDPTIEGVAEFVRRLQTSEPENTAVRGAESTLAAILGRTARETARPVTWKEMMEGG